MTDAILCVDDDANILDGYKRHLRKEFKLEVAVGAEQGLQMMAGWGETRSLESSDESVREEFYWKASPAPTALDGRCASCLRPMHCRARPGKACGERCATACLRNAH